MSANQQKTVCDCECEKDTPNRGLLLSGSAIKKWEGWCKLLDQVVLKIFFYKK